MILNNTILCLIGKSGSGKSYIANKLHNEFGYVILDSYTTRPKRYQNEVGHVFITEEEYSNIEHKVATTYFDGYHYCATKEQADESDIYIVDINGFMEFQNLYKKFGGQKKIVSIYIHVPMDECLNRMLDRGDNQEAAWTRLKNDDHEFKYANALCDYTVNGMLTNDWEIVHKLIQAENNTEKWRKMDD